MLEFGSNQREICGVPATTSAEAVTLLSLEDDLLVVASDAAVNLHCLCVEQDLALGALDKDAVFMEEVLLKVKSAARFIATVLALLLLVRSSAVSAIKDLAP